MESVGRAHRKMELFLMFKSYNYIYQNKQYISKYQLANEYNVTLQTVMHWLDQKIVLKKEVENLGLKHHPLNAAYRSMLKRCYSTTYRYYKRYGGRGIRVHRPWLENFQNFVNDMGPCPIKYELDRIDNNKNYTPENCRWVSHKENMQNSSTAKRWYVHGKKFNSCGDAATYFKTGRSTIREWVYGKIGKNGLHILPKKDCYTVNVY